MLQSFRIPLDTPTKGETRTRVSPLSFSLFEYPPFSFPGVPTTKRETQSFWVGLSQAPYLKRD